nr:MAG TPA: hypothetical protein [Caudoviricetes sp.]
MTYEIVGRASKGNADGFVFSGRGEAATLCDFDVQNGVGHTKLSSIQCDNSIHLSNLLCSYQLCNVSERINIGIEEIVVPQPEVCVLDALVRLTSRVVPNLVPPVLVVRIALCERLLNGLCQLSTEHTGTVVVTSKELMCVLTRYNAEQLAIVKDISTVFFAYSHSGEIHLTANRFVLEASMHNVFHPFFLFL